MIYRRSLSRCARRLKPIQKLSGAAGNRALVLCGYPTAGGSCSGSRRAQYYRLRAQQSQSRATADELWSIGESFPEPVHDLRQAPGSQGGPAGTLTEGMRIVCCDDRCLWTLRRNCDGNHATAGAQIQYARGLYHFDGMKRALNQQFCFRARNQYIGRDLKIKPEKFTLSDQIGHRFSVIAPLLQTPEGIGLRWLKLLMRARHQLGAPPTQCMREQNARLHRFQCGRTQQIIRCDALIHPHWLRAIPPGVRSQAR